MSCSTSGEAWRVLCQLRALLATVLIIVAAKSRKCGC